MSKVIAGMTTSLDGFVAEPSGSVDRLYPDLADLHGTRYMDELIERTGAVIMGRKAFEMADERLTFTFVTDGIASAVAQAKAAAGTKEVQVIGGASVVRQVLQAGLVGEFHLDVMPVPLGGGLRLFEDGDLQGLRLEKLAVLETGPRTMLSFRVGK